MRCTECGAPGYSRKTKTPEWRCRSQNCGHEWDATTPRVEELEALRREADRRERELRLEEEERRRNDQTELEALREEVDIKEREFNSLRRERLRTENNTKRGGAFATAVFVIGLIGASVVGWSGPGIFLGILALSVGAYVLAANWNNWTS